MWNLGLSRYIHVQMCLRHLPCTHTLTSKIHRPRSTHNTSNSVVLTIIPLYIPYIWKAITWARTFLEDKKMTNMLGLQGLVNCISSDKALQELILVWYTQLKHSPPTGCDADSPRSILLVYRFYSLWTFYINMVTESRLRRGDRNFIEFLSSALYRLRLKESLWKVYWK